MAERFGLITPTSILARDYNLPIHVFDFDKPGAMKDVFEGENVGTIINRESTVEYNDQ